MDAAKDLLKRAVELDSAEKYTEALICYEEGIQNVLRAMRGQCTLDIDNIDMVTRLYYLCSRPASRKPVNSVIHASCRMYN